MKVHLVDGTYELFRHFYGAPSAPQRRRARGGAVRGVVGSVLQLLGEGATHVGVATDHVIESFRNELWPGYKTGEGIDPELWSAGVAARGRRWRPSGCSCGRWSTSRPTTPWPARRRSPPLTPRSSRSSSARRTRTWGSACDGTRVVQLDRRKNLLIDEGGDRGQIRRGARLHPRLPGPRSGTVPTASRGCPGWGAKSAATVLARWEHLEAIPPDPAATGRHGARGAKLATTLRERRDDAVLFKELATLRVDRSLLSRVEDLRWRGPTDDFPRVCDEFDASGLAAGRRRWQRRAETVAQGPWHPDRRGVDSRNGNGTRPNGQWSSCVRHTGSPQSGAPGGAQTSLRPLRRAAA